MDKIKTAREAFTLNSKKLRRARHIYVLFARKGITNTMQLNYAAKRMRKFGLYANPELKSVHDVTYSILRHMWKIDGGCSRPWPNPNDWSHWAERNGWDIAHRCRISEVAA